MVLELEAGTRRVRGRYGQAHTVPHPARQDRWKPVPWESLCLTGQRGSRCGEPTFAPRHVCPVSRCPREPKNRRLTTLFLVGDPIVGATIGAHYGFHIMREAVIGSLAGLAVGAFLAVVVCGLLALIVSVHDILNDIHHLSAEATADTTNRAPASDRGPVSPRRQ